MLDKNCKKVLKICNKYLRQKTIINTSDLQKYINLSEKDIMYICMHLNDLGYFQSFQKGITEIVVFEPSYKLYFYKEQIKTERREFIKKVYSNSDCSINSHNCPVIFANTTAVITDANTDITIVINIRCSTIKSQIESVKK